MSSIETPPGKFRSQRRAGLPPSASVLDREYADPAKALVMAHISQLVGGGHADWRPLEDGAIELSLAGGEVFVLGQVLITRIR